MSRNKEADIFAKSHPLWDSLKAVENGCLSLTGLCDDSLTELKARDTTPLATVSHFFSKPEPYQDLSTRKNNCTKILTVINKLQSAIVTSSMKKPEAELKEAGSLLNAADYRSAIDAIDKDHGLIQKNFGDIVFISPKDSASDILMKITDGLAIETECTRHHKVIDEAFLPKEDSAYEPPSFSPR